MHSLILGILHLPSRSRTGRFDRAPHGFSRLIDVVPMVKERATCARVGGLETPLPAACMRVDQEVESCGGPRGGALTVRHLSTRMLLAELWGCRCLSEPARLHAQRVGVHGRG
jgi:hypothetical protein